MIDYRIDYPPGLVPVDAQVKRAADIVSVAVAAELKIRLAWAVAFGYDLAVSETVFTGDDVKVWYQPIEPGAAVEDTRGLLWWVYRYGGGA